MERDEQAQHRATKELAKLFMIYGLGADAAKRLAADQVTRVSSELLTILSPLKLHAA